MKKALLLFLLISSCLNAQNGFEQGNALYNKGKYSEAITAYEGVLKTKKHSAELYFNIANSYYKLNKVGPSIYNYEKALLLSPNDKEIQNNLNFAKKAAIDDIKEVPNVGFNKMIQDVTSVYQYNTWAWIAVGFSFVFLLLFLGYYLSGTTLSKRLFFIGMFIALLIIAISISSALFEKSIYERDRPAIVFEDILPVKTEPKADAPDAFLLHEGAKVYILDTLDTWRKIQLTDETQGWVEEKAIKEIK